MGLKKSKEVLDSGIIKMSEKARFILLTFAQIKNKRLALNLKYYFFVIE